MSKKPILYYVIFVCVIILTSCSSIYDTVKSGKTNSLLSSYKKQIITGLKDYDYTEESSKIVSAKENLTIETPRGDIIIEPAKSDKIEIKIFKTANGSDVKIIKDVFDRNIHINFLESPQALKIAANIDFRPSEQTGNIDNVNVHFRISIPPEFVNQISLFSGHGAIFVENVDCQITARTFNHPLIVSSEKALTKTDLKNSNALLLLKSPIYEYGEHILTNNNGLLVLNIPEVSKMTLYAKTNNAKIQTNFVVEGSKFIKECISGTINNGGAKVNLFNSNSDIYILKY